MNVVLGLGNPGTRYENTRHNIGWLILDAVATRLGTNFTPGRGEYYEAPARWRGTDFLLIKPMTYMNKSGVAARQLTEQLDIIPENMLVVVDELQFPVGRIKLKPAGSAGGHNGVESLIYHLESDRFPRLRCGVGNNFGRGEMVPYVLSPFSEDEREDVDDMIVRGSEAVLTWISDGTPRAMNMINTQAGSEPDNPEPTQNSTDTTDHQ